MPLGEEMRLLSHLEVLPLASQLRVPQHLTFQLLEDPKSISRPLAHVVQCWAAAYHAMLEWGKDASGLQEMVSLLRLGDATLRRQLLASEPLQSLLRPPPFLLFLLQALHLQPVVQADVKAFVEQRLSSFRHLPRAWRQAPPLQLHPLPMDDGVSNAQRAKRMPFCLDVMLFATRGAPGQPPRNAWKQCSKARKNAEKDRFRMVSGGFWPGFPLFRFRFGMLAKQAMGGPPPSVRLWDVGANGGDCSASMPPRLDAKSHLSSS